jgi:cell division septation protein DedD
VVQAPAQPSPPVAVVRPPAKAPELKPAPEPKPAPVKQSPPPSAGKTGAYRLQIGAVRSEAAAQQEWDRLKKSQKDLLGGVGAGWSRADLGERGVFYRILAGPIDDGAAAERICGELKKRSVGCILVRQ